MAKRLVNAFPVDRGEAADGIFLLARLRCNHTFASVVQDADADNAS